MPSRLENNIPSRFGCWYVPCRALTGTTYTVVPKDFGTCLTNRGIGAMAITLPDAATVPVGSWVMYFQVAAGNFSIGATDQIIALNNAAADAVGWETDGEEIGNGLMAINLGAKWMIEMHIADEANTVTVTSA
jgi:hypothetical protein